MDRVYCMTRSHLDDLRGLLPPGKDRHVALLDPAGGDVPDPIGGGRAEYLSAAKRIRAAIEARVGEWA
jgi:protein-tyrosine-phosphatase